MHIDRTGRGWTRYVPFKDYVAYPQHAFFNASGKSVRTLAGYPAD